MPTNISAASPVGVFPQSLCSSFSESRAYETLVTPYHDASREIGLLVASSRRTFKQSKRLTVTQTATLKAFWDSVLGGMKAFYFYNPYEGSPVGANYDATGSSATGRHLVVFRGSWAQSTEYQRTSIPSLELVEVS